MLTKRIIPCLDIKDGKVVKGTNFKSLIDVGDPIESAIKYFEDGADELCFLDITATIENRKTILQLVKKIAKNIFIPFTVGGGIKTIQDIENLLKAGADKITFCSEAVKNPQIIKKASDRFGSQCIVISIDVKRKEIGWECYINGGRKNTEIDAIKFAKQCECLGAGEILLNSLDQDGTKQGYDLDILKIISNTVNIPVIASSGVGSPKDILEAFTIGCADAALAASIFHYDKYSIGDVKKYLKSNGVEIR